MALPKIYENDLDKAMFPIRVSPVYYRPTSDNMAIDDPNHKVIMRQDNKQVLGIVSSRYKIYTHALAYELGCELFQTVFGLNPELFKVDVNKLGSYCHIDLLNENNKIDIKGGQKNLFNEWEEGQFRDIYYPFLRISNSYNRTLSMRFTLGFYRWKCSNGLLMGYDKLADITISHSTSYSDAREKVFKKAAGINKRTREFKQFIENTRKLTVPKELLEVVVLDMLDKQYDSTKTPELIKIKKIISKSVPRYIDQLGETALTAINIATDYIKYIENTSNVNVLQSKPLQWGMKLSKPGFKMDEYLKEQSRYNRETYKQIAA